MKRKKIRYSIYIPAFLLTIIMFLIGFIIGSSVSDIKLQNVYDLQNDIRIESLGNELMFELVSEDLCNSANLSTYTLEMTSLGKRLDYLESLEGYDSPRVASLKNYYSLLLIRHWLITQKLKESCDDEKGYVLFFYTNIGNCEDCEDQGLVLTNVHRNYPDFYVYSFEYYLDNAALDLLKERYNITSYRLPTLVVDDSVYYGFRSKGFIKQALNVTDEDQED